MPFSGVLGAFLAVCGRLLGFDRDTALKCVKRCFRGNADARTHGK